MSDLISRKELCKAMYHEAFETDSDEQRWDSGCWIRYKMFERIVERMPSAQDKYEYHYDHTDCIWYRPEARNRCPSTCAQYRDGWNDAMNYIFRDGKGYMPYRRDKQYEE